MQILVTGGAGFIGSNFVRYLLDTYESVEVVVLDALTYAGSRDNLKGVIGDSRHEFVKGDIRDRELVFDLIEDVDAVVNFAAESHVDRSIDSARSFVDTNVKGTQTLLEASRKSDVDRFLQVSTDEVYGEVLSGTCSEESRLNPRNPYAASKADADLLALSYETTHNLPVLITRTCNNFGPRQHPEKLIPKFIKRAAAGEELPVYGDGSNVREWIYAEDNCRAIDLALREGEIGEIYNIGSGEERTNLEVAEEILGAVGGSKEQITFVEDRPGHDQRYALDSEKIRKLGWESEWTFEEGLAKTVESYL